MGTRFTRLLLSTALTIPAGVGIAQAQDKPCEELSSLIRDGVPQQAEMSKSELKSIVENADADACETQLTKLTELKQDGGDGSQRDSDTANADDSTSQDTAKDEDTATAEASADAEVAEREQTKVELDAERIVEGVVTLNRTAPQVEVDEGQTEVTVDNAKPDVSVEQGRPEITVRQPQATVTFEMAQPTVTIDQPAPEIIVTMPDPNVSVANAKPKVEVRQGEPEVKVSQAAPAVNLDLNVVSKEEASGDGIQVEDSQSGETYAQGEEQKIKSLDNAQVSVNRSEPKVTYRTASDASADARSDESDKAQTADAEAMAGQSGGANVSVASAQKPKVTYEGSEPKVDVKMTGEPKVQIQQSGEPKVTFKTASDQGSDMKDQSRSEDSDMQQADAQSGQDDQKKMSDDQQTASADAQSDAKTGSDAETASMSGDASDSQAEQSGEQQANAGASKDEKKAGDEQQANAQSSDEQQASNGEQQASNDIQREGFQGVEPDQVEVDALTDAALFNKDDERIGDIGDVVLGDDEHVQKVVVGVGGFLGLGEREVALPMDDLSLLRAKEGDELRVYTDHTREELENMKEYKQQG